MFLGMRVFVRGAAKVIIMEREDWMIFIKYVANGVLHCNSCSFAICLIYGKESFIHCLVATKHAPSHIGKKETEGWEQSGRYALAVSLLQ